MAPVAHAQRDNEGVWEFRISTGAMASGSIDETCRRQTLENASDAQAREALNRLGHAVVAACEAAGNRKRETADALRKAVAESATPPLFHT